MSEIEVSLQNIKPRLEVVRSTDTLYDAVRGLLKFYHPNGLPVGFGSVLFYFALLEENTNSIMAVAVVSKMMPQVFNRAKKEIEDFKKVRYERSLFIRRITSIPPFRASARLLLEIEGYLKPQGYQALTSYIYPQMQGKLYQLAKWKKGWTRRGYTFVYKILI